jgi:hypothetical protein
MHTITLVTDPSVTVTIKRLGFLAKRAAQKASQRTAMADLREMGGAAFLEELKALQTSTPAPVAPGPVDPLLTHDLLTVLIGGIVEFSDKRTVSKDTLGDLDEVDAEAIGRAILALSPAVPAGNAA